MLGRNSASLRVVKGLESVTFRKSRTRRILECVLHKHSVSVLCRLDDAKAEEPITRRPLSVTDLIIVNVPIGCESTGAMHDSRSLHTNARESFRTAMHCTVFPGLNMKDSQHYTVIMHIAHS